MIGIRSQDCQCRRGSTLRRYGDFRSTLFIAVCRDPFAFWFNSIRRDDSIGKRIEGKAELILAAIEAKDTANLRCELSHC